VNPVWVALDTPDLSAAEALARAVAPHTGGVKLGLEFFSANGRAGVERIAALDAPVFLDLKLHDIPNTVAGAMRALARLEPDIVTVHAAGGHAMMRAAKTSAPAGTRVVAVTVLTSMDSHDLAELGLGSFTTAQLAARYAAAARAAGLDGFVSSAAEVRELKAAWPDALAVVPGIRPEGEALGDQKRAMTPREALAAGADVLVIGRPITAAPDPATAARAIAAAL
jgi:orotidine-5'-phosphate decarboxylase